MKDVLDILQPIADKVCYELFSVARAPLCMEKGNIRAMPWLAIRSRKGQRLQIDKWWSELPHDDPNKTPVLLYKHGTKPWRAVVMAALDAGRYGVDVMADMAIEDFLCWFEERLTYEIERGQFIRDEAQQRRQQKLFSDKMNRIINDKDS